ncbi:MAG: FMN-binding protein, partial [Candidatus Omnitrophica bacterium]|nr:FMN-binding protein [Candidatus Omnitrophota bacterium]
MRRAILFKAIVFITLLTALGANIYGRSRPDTKGFSGGELQTVMPEGEFFKKNEKPFLYHEVYKKNRLIGYCFNTRDVAPEEKGYSGPLEILVGLDKEGNILNLEVLRHNETPQYASGITSPEFLGQFKGKGASDRFIVGEDIDGITQATISSKSVARILKAALERFDSLISERSFEILRRPSWRTPQDENSGTFPDFHITVLIIIFLLLAFYFNFKWLRYTGLFISILYFGFYKAVFISMSNLGSILLWNLPDFRSNMSWYVFIFSGLILTFLISAFFCSYMCPFGALQIFLNKIFKFNLEMSSESANRLRKIRWILLWLLALLVLVLNNSNIVNYEPFSTVFLRRGSIIAWGIAFIVLGLSLFHYRPFCRYFCATGAFLDMLS